MASTKLALRRVHTGTFTGDQTQRLAQQAAQLTNGAPFLSGRLLKRVAIGTSATTINHGLGRAWQGWFLTRLGTSTTVLESATQPPDASKQINLQAGFAVTVDLWIF